MKLELKHLAPYLPYELKIHCPNDSDGEVQILSGLTIEDGVQTDYLVVNGDTKGNYWALQGERNYGYYGIKPILRPLSDLTKEIEHDGKKFIPIDKLRQTNPNTPNWTKVILQKGHVMDFYLNNKGVLTQTIIEYVVVEKLFEWHFDVFGLIHEGLAVDLNTINN